MKHFKDLLYLIIITVILFVSLIFILALLVCGGGSSSTPIQPPVSEKKATHYAAISSELGVPWELVLLSDYFYAHQNKKSDIEHNNPLVTATEFLILNEVKEIEESIIEGYDEKGKPIYSYIWKYDSTIHYHGKNEILSYAGISENDLYNHNPSTLISLLQERASKKSSSTTNYTISFSSNTDLDCVLKDYIGIDENNQKKIIEIYESKYLQNLYFSSNIHFSFDSISLPNVTTGNVTREDLAKVAVSIIGLPYNWGGKSPHRGLPKNNLDCSGYIDWVYIQCFGRGVNGGVPPKGIIANGTSMQFYSCQEIDEQELKIGDLGFVHRPEDVVDFNHVGIYIGEIDGYKAFVHCGGSSFGTDDSPTGRVGISLNNAPGKWNSKNSVTGGEFSPAMKNINFKYFRRPQFLFLDDN